MTATSIILALRVGYYDSKAAQDAGKEVVLATPMLDIYFSEKDVIASEEGIEIIEGELSFFAASGAPLEAHFSEKPYIDKKRNTYFAGAYSLRPGSGPRLPEVLARFVSQNAPSHTHIIVHAPATDEVAQWYGWRQAAAMKQDINSVLAILPPDLAKRVTFEVIKP